MKIKFTISSRKAGYLQTYPVVIGNLLSNGIPPEDIYFVIGGYSKTEHHLSEEGVNIIQVPQNSIDYTGLIAVLEENIEADYWMLLHDTCYVGPNFYKTVMEYPYKSAPAVALSSDLSMNIGAYSWGYLQGIKEEILKYHNEDFSEEAIQYWKQKGVADEDMFLHNYRSLYHFTGERRQSSGPVDIYGTGVPRMIEYFPGIDFYKVKANWHNKSVYELNV